MLDILGGLALNYEEFSDTPRNERLEGVLGAAYRLRSSADADLALTVYPNFEDDGRVRVEFDGSLSFDVLSDLDFKITVFDRYDSRPPPRTRPRPRQPFSGPAHR